MYRQDQPILQNEDILGDRHIPQVIHARQNLINDFLRLLYPVTEGRKPINCWFFGRTGTGKTAAARWILRKLERESGVRGIHINCWENPTFFSILDSISRKLRMLGAEKLSTSFKLERLKRYLSGQQLVLFLDEIDQAAPKERNAILYNLSELSQTGIICSCNSQNTFLDLEERVKSRLNPARVIFKKYTDDEMLEILHRRATEALAPGTFSHAALREAARLSDGDARIAIKTLANAAYLAEKDSQEKIVSQHIIRAWNSAKEMKKTYLLRKLTDHHRLLYELITKNPKILSGDLWRQYLDLCKMKNIRPIAIRTYSDYCNELVKCSLVQSKRAAIQGKVREFNVIK